MEFKMSNQFEELKKESKIVENENFFSDPVSIVIEEKFLRPNQTYLPQDVIATIKALLSGVENLLEREPNISNSYFIFNEKSLVMKGARPWTKEKIDLYKKCEEDMTDDHIENENIQLIELENLRLLMAKYPQDTAKFLVEKLASIISK